MLFAARMHRRMLLETQQFSARIDCCHDSSLPGKANVEWMARANRCASTCTTERSSVDARLDTGYRQTATAANDFGHAKNMMTGSETLTRFSAPYVCSAVLAISAFIRLSPYSASGRSPPFRICLQHDSSFPSSSSSSFCRCRVWLRLAQLVVGCRASGHGGSMLARDLGAARMFFLHVSKSPLLTKGFRSPFAAFDAAVSTRSCTARLAPAAASRLTIWRQKKTKMKTRRK
ncbi:hypothetical protein HPB49_024780 [Dermacentor silvarum]|uniref:Uncharacterized protein n=1 Tax=Dermacentor silvarum TaxID=543639 RepID=A0ACB8DLP8_DERSI|nr:hypothetical protein HPB49_024780 [Dermacentor silvarum]